jgi:hypothetical protein
VEDAANAGGDSARAANAEIGHTWTVNQQTS